MPPVDDRLAADHEAAFVRGKKDHRIGDLDGLAEPASRHEGEHRLGACFAFGGAETQFAVELLIGVLGWGPDPDRRAKPLICLI